MPGDLPWLYLRPFGLQPASRSCGAHGACLHPVLTSVIRFCITPFQMTVKCPICQGSGKVEDPRAKGMDETAARRVMARALRAEGYSLRQIMRLCGWKSVRSASLAMEEQPQ